MRYLTYTASGSPIAVFNTIPVSSRHILIDESITDNDLKLMKVDLSTLQLVPKEITIDRQSERNLKADGIRLKRSNLLQQTDWTQLPDVPLETSNRYKNYRQSLRDITKQPGFPEDIIWPELPYTITTGY
jgi:hypothetical protein